jgi:hypothetical protein
MTQSPGAQFRAARKYGTAHSAFASKAPSCSTERFSARPPRQKLRRDKCRSRIDTPFERTESAPVHQRRTCGANRCADVIWEGWHPHRLEQPAVTNCTVPLDVSALPPTKQRVFTGTVGRPVASGNLPTSVRAGSPQFAGQCLHRDHQVRGNSRVVFPGQIRKSGRAPLMEAFRRSNLAGTLRPGTTLSL